MDDKLIVLVTGMSGAGKTSAMVIFENLEFHCIDNYPVSLLTEFASLIKDNDSYEKIALGVSLKDAVKAVTILNELPWINLVVLFLDAADDVLLNRYKFTRRAHPLLISKTASSLVEAIGLERELSQLIMNEANEIIDTSTLKLFDLQEAIESYFMKSNQNNFRISFVSFGYKHGIPRDADLLFDVRFLPNPYWVESLKLKTGFDEEVYSYVIDSENTKIFLEKIVDFLDYLCPNFEKEGKMHLVVGIGCTGGQHRSVALTRYLSKYYSEKYVVSQYHRDVTH